MNPTIEDLSVDLEKLLAGAHKYERLNTDKLYLGLRQAIADLRLVHADKKYTVNMESFHRPEPSEYVFGLIKISHCHVCLAGAVMAKSFEADINAYVSPTTYPPATNRMLNAMDSIRCGRIAMALRAIFGDMATEEQMNNARSIDNATVIGSMNFNTNPMEYLCELEKIAAMLEEVDL